ncbi:gamma interferon inducible lysosomal thiol reductase GILT protein, putative [Rhizoctonia solani AG-3 Rhs1AP]|uniref:Gamma interferon inducible lysosomal thiol reductase GILT protein, putative n=2 Tax=Rhizoctonia solani AG-3 TaxID=1086053 RepID=X8JTV7_9AGAM|nr:gamma interferon inducible lysosomal thiol reductase GILT protein, putative [Rhizoctonia solani AG-3 Rhs1AP]KEP46227.1 putative gamma interferon inducible lysosomal thiol reductase GILT protein [Rhizoctonia solani 123E]
MLFAALLFPLLAKATFIPEIISQDASVTLVKDYKVPITLGVMSRCPDALMCEEVFNNVVNRVSDKIDIGLAFIGTVNASEPLYGVTCMHGEFECAGNVHELCAIAHTSSHNEWWPFMRCLNYHGRSQIGLEDVSRKCARVVGLDWDQSGIGACVSGDEGKRLLRESVEYSKRNHITTSCTIIINGKVRCIRDSTWKECDDGHTPADFVHRINSEYDKLNSKNLDSNVTEISM